MAALLAAMFAVFVARLDGSGGPRPRATFGRSEGEEDPRSDISPALVARELALARELGVEPVEAPEEVPAPVGGQATSPSPAGAPSGAVQSAPVAVTGRVLRDDGRPAAGIALRIEGSDDRRARTTTSSDGVFLLQGLRRGPHRILLGDHEEPFLEPFEVDLESPLTLLSDVSLPPVGGIDVTVVDAAGIPVGGAEVRCRGATRGVARTTTSPEGTAHLDLLTPGDLRVFARHEAFGRANLPHRLEAGAAETVEIRLVTGAGASSSGPAQPRDGARSTR